jgi:hypothetical protein
MYRYIFKWLRTELTTVLIYRLRSLIDLKLHEFNVFTKSYCSNELVLMKLLLKMKVSHE